MVKFLACGARVPGFDSRSRHLDFRDWVSPASKSQYDYKNVLKRDANPQNNPTSRDYVRQLRLIYISVMSVCLSVNTLVQRDREIKHSLWCTIHYE